MSQCRCRGTNHVCQPGEEKEMILRGDRPRMESRIMTAFRDMPIEDQINIILKALLNRFGEKCYHVSEGEIERAFDIKERIWVKTETSSAVIFLEEKNNEAP